MPRFRLRFLLQECDLTGPEAILGRSPDCHITIEDPLVSRRHARIVVQGSVAAVEDLGSRNGVRVNGKPIRDRTVLADGDRVLLGTQELVFSVASKRERPVRPTGYMRMCERCRTAYPEGTLVCPHCGAPALDEEETFSGVMMEPQRNWTLHLLGEVIERALSTERTSEADRLMRRAAKEVDDRLAAGERLRGDPVALMSSLALRLAALSKSSEWVMWVLTLHRQHGRMMAPGVIDELEKLELSNHLEVLSALSDFVMWYRASPPSFADPHEDGLSRVEGLIGERSTLPETPPP